MATEKNISSRIINKHDIEANWNKATNFIPKAGEIIVYDRDETYDYERFKIGDGETVVVNLPFAIVQPDWNQNDENAPDYVKNKPFGEFDNTMNIGVAPGGQSMAPIPANTEFTASCNGTTKTFNTSSLSNPKSFVGGMSIVYSRGMVVVINQNPQARYTVTLRYNVVQQLDEQYIPDTITRTTDVDEKISEHNSSTEAHPDIRSDISSSITALKDELLNGAGEAYDTLKELGDLINENQNAIEVLETVATGKADKVHSHDDLYYTELEVDNMFDAVETTVSQIASGTIVVEKANKDAAGNVINSTYETKSDATTKFNNAKTHAEQQAAQVKTDLIGGADEEHDTLKKLGTLIEENSNEIDQLTDNKQNKLSGAVGQVVSFDADGNAIAQDNPQPDWNQNDETALDYIKNKPDEDDAFIIVTEMGLVSPTTADDGSIYTDENGYVYSL